VAFLHTLSITNTLSLGGKKKKKTFFNQSISRFNGSVAMTNTLFNSKQWN